jgi:hypothetical protein
MQYSRRFAVCLSLSLVSTSAIAADKAAFCASHRSPEMAAVFEDESMRLPFPNRGGLAGGGVCWWHGRFQRAAWHLAAFDPSLEKPDVSARREIVRRLASRQEVVEVPGYRDLAEFAAENEDLIQKELEAWQIRDALINHAYIRGLSGRSEFRKDRMQRHMDRLYLRFQEAKKQGEALWVMLQMRGIASHSSLVHSIEPLSDGGYFLYFVDSNFPQILIEYRYVPGDTTLTPENGYDEWIEWVPFVGLERDYARIHRAVRRYCEDVGVVTQGSFR